MGQLEPRFFWIDGHDLEAFDSLERMARSVEAYDVNDLLFVDAHGTRLTATTQGHAVTGFVVTPDAANESTTLESALRHVLDAADPNSAMRSSSRLPELIERFLAHKG